MRQNPIIATYPVDTKYDKENPLNLNEINFNFAFIFNGWDSSEMIHREKGDPNFVKAIVRFYGFNKGAYFERDIPHHKCTEEEYAKFYPIVSSEEIYLKRWKKQDLNCIDWNFEDPYLIFGDFSTDDVSQ